MSKKIWILNHYALPPNLPGGTRHYDLSKELIKKNYDITIFASGFTHSKKDDYKLFEEKAYFIDEYNGIKFVWIKTNPYEKNDSRRILNMLSYSIKTLLISKNFAKPDVIIGSSVHLFAVIAAWLLAKRYKAKFIFEVRDLWPQTPVDMGAIKSGSVVAKILYFLEKLMYQKADKIIVLLPNAREYIVSRGIDENKIVWIPNGVDLKRFETPSPLDSYGGLNEFFKNNDGKFIVMYTGAHGPANGLDIFIDAASYFQKNDKNIAFCLVGDGVDKGRLQEEVERRKLENIKFFQSVTKKEIPALLKYSDLLVQSFALIDVLKYGISPNKIFDYLAAGKPIIMSVKTTNNIVQDAGAGIVIEPGNANAFIQGILKIKEMSLEEREELGENGRLYVNEYHNIEVLADKLEKIL